MTDTSSTAITCHLDDNGLIQMTGDFTSPVSGSIPLDA